MLKSFTDRVISRHSRQDKDDKFKIIKYLDSYIPAVECPSKNGCSQASLSKKLFSSKFDSSDPNLSLIENIIPRENDDHDEYNKDEKDDGALQEALGVDHF